MEVAGVVVAALCALAIAGLWPPVVRAKRRGARYAGLCALSLAVAGLALAVAFVALALGAARADTGRFLMGMGVGVAVGLTLGCAALLAVERRAA